MSVADGRHNHFSNAELEEIVQRFKQAWQSGKRPKIDDFLPGSEPQLRAALIALAAIDLEQRLKAGETARVEDYLECYPALAEDPEAVIELIKVQSANCGNSETDNSSDPYCHPTSESSNARAAPSTEGETPVQLGRYRVTAKLGSGGFGAVYRGYDADLQREVAIKVPLRSRIANPRDAEAYLAEARIVASLKHPHIVPVFDLGRTDDGVCFVVSQLVDGNDLATVIKDSRLAATKSAALVATIAEALHYAHKRGLVHRDVKPGNILIERSGTPYLADFGLALKEEDYGKHAAMCGTPAYMSPEQATGEGHRVDGRSDIFSLGVVFYELLTGRRPFRGDRTQVLDQIVNDEPCPPRQIDDAISKELERICLKALCKRASERYTTAKDMADDLRNWQGGAGVVEPEPLRVDPTAKDAFLSYATPDREVAFQLCRGLEDKGIGCWISPRDVTPGADQGEAIIHAIETTTATLLLLSRHSNDSAHVAREVERATTKHKRVIPVRLANIVPAPSLELLLASARWVDAWRLTPDKVVEELVQAIRSSLSTPLQPVKIVPKGLRSFDVTDADFFLELLPGPRDRHGLPDSLRFWKSRIETADADSAFAVGLIYGPSGCGKSSLVKAGLLPRLANSITAVYIEAAGNETEKRLLNRLRRQVRDLPGNLGLTESLALLRRGKYLEPGHKVLLVLDQFEQWLHAKGNEENPELVQALRQCDGSRVQCLVMVRDDFWLAVSRFMRALEIVVDGENSRLVDLFDLRHAKKILTAFGRAFGAVPESQPNKEQEAFLEQSVAGLAQEGKVVSVGLAVFSEMVKGKPWTRATLKQVGGTEGVGVAFLEETFTASTAPPQHRLHQHAAQAVLRDLLPDAGTDFKGHMRSEQELRIASGYADRPRDFEDLLRILDSELRLITPADPEGKDEGKGMRDEKDTTPGPASSSDSRSTLHAPSSTRFYQLTHDYLVPSLRDWLTRKQKETRRGRAGLMLADRATVWTTRPENRQLPSLVQWLQIRWHTKRQNWTASQRKMMAKAERYHSWRGLALMACLLLLSFAGWEINGSLKSNSMLRVLFGSPTRDVPGIVKEMGPYRHWLDSRLADAFTEAQENVQQRKQLPANQQDKQVLDSLQRKQLHASLALLPKDASQVQFLYDRILEAQPQEISGIQEMLWDHRQDLTERLWALLKNPKNDQLDERQRAKQLRAASALAFFAPEDSRWENVRAAVAENLLRQETFEIASWTQLLKPARKFMFAPLAVLLSDEKRTDAQIKLIAKIYEDYAQGEPDAYEHLKNRMMPDDASSVPAKGRANVALAFLLNGRGDQVWPLLEHSSDPSLRSFLIERMGPCGVDWKVLRDRLNEEKVVSITRAILLSLGQNETDSISFHERKEFEKELLNRYETDSDPGIHSAIAWLLQEWDAEGKIKELDEKLKEDMNRREHIRHELPSRLESAPPGKPVYWYVNSEGQTMVVIAKPGLVQLSKRGNLPQGSSSQLANTIIDHSLEIAATDVTVEQFRRFRPAQKQDNNTVTSAPLEDDCPAIEVSWYDAAAYCNWLSGKEKLDNCYEEDAKGHLKPKESFLLLSGYRLPTEMEWEYACRANSGTNYAFGQPEELLAKYAWYAGNSIGNVQQVGLLKPNDFGLFDTHGNVWQWCNDVFDQGRPIRMARGCGWFSPAACCWTSFRRTGPPDYSGNGLGFRIARSSVALAK